MRTVGSVTRHWAVRWPSGNCALDPAACRCGNSRTPRGAPRTQVPIHTICGMWDGDRGGGIGGTVQRATGQRQESIMAAPSVASATGKIVEALEIAEIAEQSQE